MNSQLGCERCGGCGDYDCWGCGAPRWCNATASGGGCDACLKPTPREARPPWWPVAAEVPCVRNRHHAGECKPGNYRSERWLRKA